MENPQQELPPLPQDSSSFSSQTKSSPLFIVFKYVALGMSIIGIGFLIAIGGYLFALHQNTSTLSPTPIPSTSHSTVSSDRIGSGSVTPPLTKDSIIEDTTVPGQKKYTSYRLGVSFLFMPNNNQIGIKEVGDTIYVYPYPDKNDYTKGQYVKVFQKSSQMTTKQAIEKMFLQGYSPSDCFVGPGKPDAGAKYPANYDTLTITVPHTATDDMGTLMTKWQKCPQPYTEANGISYFLGDTNHPKTLLFFSIGQYPISADNGQKTWQDTIEFL